MSGFLSLTTYVLIFVFVLIVLMCINEGGINTTVDIIRRVFKRNPANNLRSIGDKLSNFRQSMNSEMKIIRLATGQCERCGDIFVCTNEDKVFPIQKVEFMGESKLLCKKCIDSIFESFHKKEKSNMKHFSDSAKAFRALITDNEISK